MIVFYISPSVCILILVLIPIRTSRTLALRVPACLSRRASYIRLSLHSLRLSFFSCHSSLHIPSLMSLTPSFYNENGLCLDPRRLEYASGGEWTLPMPDVGSIA